MFYLLEEVNTYRDSYDIIKEILESLPEAKTRIMYRAALSWDQLNEYLDMLLHHRLITPVQWSNGKYYITQKGEEYLSMLDQLLVLQK